MCSIHCLNLATKIRAPVPALANPAIVKEMPNSFFPKLQAVTRSPTNAIIAPRTQVSKGNPNL